MGEDVASGQVREKKKKGFKVNKNLIMLKLTLFFLYGATSSLMPYLTIHMQSIGLTIEEIAITYLALPFTTFLAPPVTGFLVDKFGQYKPVVIVSFILNAAIHHSLMLIPHQETPGVRPSGYVMRHPQGDVEVWWSPCPSRECPEAEILEISLDNCVDHCMLRRRKKTQRQTKGFERTITEAIKIEADTLQPNGTDIENSTAVSLVLDMHPDLGDPVEQIGIEMDSVEDDELVADYKQRFKKRLLRRNGVNVTALDNSDLRCGGIMLSGNYSTDNLNLTSKYGDCILQKCTFVTNGPDVCPPDFNESDDRTFWTYFLLRFVGTIMMTSGVTMMDPIALTMIEKYGGDFGREKLFSSIGMALFSPITGILIDINSRSLSYTDYSAAFYTYDVLLLISALTVFLMPLGSKLPADNIFRDLVNIFKMPNVIMFIIFLFVLGNLWGFIESFLFFYLKDLGAPNYLLGITVTVGTLSSMPFLYGAEKITKKIGHVNIIVLAFFAHAGRLMGYSFIESAWWCFPFEAMESLSVHLMWVAAATYCAILAPKNLLATLIGVIGMAHFSIGRGSGSFIGGHLIGKVGIRQAFRLMGLMAVISGSIYGLLHYYWLRKIEYRFKEEDDAIDICETDKLKEVSEIKYKDQSTSMSLNQLRLSLMIEYNQIGSLTSLGRYLHEHPSIKRTRSNSMRRGSYSIGMFQPSRGSASKVDLLKSTVEVNNAKNSNPQLKYAISYSNGQTNHSGKTFIEVRQPSTPKLARKSISLIADKEMDKTLIPDEAEEIIYSTKQKIDSKKNSS